MKRIPSFLTSYIWSGVSPIGSTFEPNWLSIHHFYCYHLSLSFICFGKSSGSSSLPLFPSLYSQHRSQNDLLKVKAGKVTPLKTLQWLCISGRYKPSGPMADKALWNLDLMDPGPIFIYASPLILLQLCGPVGCALNSTQYASHSEPLHVHLPSRDQEIYTTLPNFLRFHSDCICWVSFTLFEDAAPLLSALPIILPCFNFFLFITHR